VQQRLPDMRELGIDEGYICLFFSPQLSTQ